ncbi:MAG: hypothetical protein FRX48_03963 [Lasallia pustulata]|uniref:Dol-P-Glc:Glc(2)Man(9)GlcNAc(2)-PP-Dol alpha-1,2-glucosyltransferase n=1 Tax=Lasallia pustulata TaxID=136370 RepID=A0A5M8PQJ5_9LECA|nr:MAG: hypothetical protein FRX48_03963 [Lasallia pustulata]
MPVSRLERLLFRPTGGPLIAHLVLLIASGYWHYKVNATVPEPYLDEVFHVRQAQAYWRGQWRIWDPKITTPPGLYIISYLHLYLLQIQGRLSNITFGLRSINFIAANVLILVLVRGLLWKIRHARVSGSAAGQRRSKQLLQWSEYEIDHVALNICLFPPLFFFYALYYTDVLSVGFVLLAYHLFLNRQTAGLMVAGLSSLLFRQTNIFWVALFLGGLEVTRSIERGDESRPAWTDIMRANGTSVRYYDPLVSEAYFEDYLKSASSITLCTLINLRTVVQSLIPHLTFLAAFSAFILWNNGVVLGDKANHIASLHLTQMLYFWTYILFFSSPLLYHYFLTLIVPPRILSKPLRSPYPSTKHALPRLAIALPITTAMLATVHFNTLIHPFTLADNRHYVFYVFRLLLRHASIKYLAIPIYLLSAHASITALSSPPTPPPPQEGGAPKATAKPETKQPPSSARETPTQGNRASFVLIWLATTALALCTAPLVEPRYFILPWLIWRLHLPPSLPPRPRTSLDRPGRKSATRKSRTLRARIKAVLYTEHDHGLWLETAWFVAVNAVTGYVFLYWGFRWEQEEGRVQRFMW